MMFFCFFFLFLLEVIILYTTGFYSLFDCFLTILFYAIFLFLMCLFSIVRHYGDKND